MNMNMHVIDWALLALPLVLVLISGIYTSRYIKGVSHFLSAGRLADRYLLAVSQGEMQAGAITFAAAFEVMSRSGVALTWWGAIGTPVWLILSISGFVLYRFRETRAMTLAQFFEVRYSKGFRIFSGSFSFLAGLMNFGIIPVIGARFFVWFLGMPLTVGFFGHSIPTEVALMGVFLTVSVTITMLGGMITMMVTDCVEGVVSQIFYLLLIFGLLAMFDWNEVGDVLTKETVVVKQTIEQTVSVNGAEERRVIEKEFNPPGRVVDKNQLADDEQVAAAAGLPLAYQPVDSLYASKDGKVVKVEKELVPREKGKSLLNPFDSSGVKDFNIWYVLMGLFLGIYGTMGWQFSGGFRGASLNAHEGRMGGVLGAWRGYGKSAAVGILVLCTLAYLQHPDFASQSATANEQISSIANPTIQKQMYIPIGLAHVLPAGLKGALCVILLMGLFSGDSTHLHSWAGIFVQDLLVPLRKKPFTAKQHILILRLAVLGVALFAFFFGWLFQPGDYIVMWWAITTSLFVAGAGAAILGGLYWKKATNAGAWTGMVTGSSLSLAAIVWRQLTPDARRAVLEWATNVLHLPLSVEWITRQANEAPNFLQMSFAIALLTVTLFIIVSLLTCRENYNMDRMLHRGQYAKPEPTVPGQEKKVTRKPSIWGRMIGLDDDFTYGDKWIAVSLFALNMVWFFIFIIGTLWNLVKPWPDAWWSAYYHFCVFVYPVFFAVITAVWFTWGGVRGMTRLFTLLRAQKVNERDDGTVVGHRNLDDIEEK
ncbi:MAG: hypothetical protein LBK71_07055 [Verrucomicrobiales bacterium]|jgi:Na+/proline symporter|nr:hypothetical protein [Verrucomicrobiales bacterium]